MTRERRRDMGDAGPAFVEREHDLAKLVATFADFVRGGTPPSTGG
jgi:hypothetical protein